ncbi:MAG: hypothetical protein KDI13_00085 [Alphaproteobacteria bacterium]|nr:hypothetical protein [Alphaproteobacteria bacterium]
MGLLKLAGQLRGCFDCVAFSFCHAFGSQYRNQMREGIEIGNRVRPLIETLSPEQTNTLYDRMKKIREMGRCRNLLESIYALSEVVRAEESLADLRDPVNEMMRWLESIDKQLRDSLSRGDPAFVSVLETRAKDEPAFGRCFSASRLVRGTR